MSDDNEKKEKLTDHNYDGIQELDNDLPRWWLGLFYISVIFAVVYYAHYEFGNGPSLQEEFMQEVSAMEAQKEAAPKSSFPESAKLVAFQKSTEKLGVGKGVFQSKCISCHGDKGQGIIGPNLADDNWLHGDGKIESIAKIIQNGVSEKGMPPWGPLLSEEEVYAVTAYVKSLRGSNPAGAKAPQGPLVKE